MKPYWHELSPEWQDAERTRKASCDEFKQPVWCYYPDALAGLLGCWSLGLGNVNSITNCWNCNLNVARPLSDCCEERDLIESH